MLRNSSFRVACAIVALISLSFLCITCGGSSHSNLTQAQAQAISAELFTALSSAMVSGLTPPIGASAADRPASLGGIVEHTQSAQPSDCVISDNGESCNIPITYQGACPKGGTISVTGDFMYTLDNSGNGSDSSTLTITPSSCALDEVTFNGNPNVTFATSFMLQNNALAFPITFSGLGGITYGPNPSGSCSINVKATATSLTSCSVSGSICGRSVSGSC
jgi:hypothetical protein